MNPDVTVRARGVMEKCTYCVQRIREAEIVARREHRAIRDGEVVTACQQACPTGAIAFGDIADPSDRASPRSRQNERLLRRSSTSSARSRARATWRASPTPTRSSPAHDRRPRSNACLARDEPTGGEAGPPRATARDARAHRRSSWRRSGGRGRGSRPALVVTGAGRARASSPRSPTRSSTGIGLWGNNIPVAWAFAITNFVWWIGIGHAGTFISAILLLLEVHWRTSINRFAEAMTLFAVVQAGLFPLLHLGRPWFAYWLVPYPVRDGRLAAVPSRRSRGTSSPSRRTSRSRSSSGTSGLLPDLAAARDRAPTLLRRRIYGIFALGWRGRARALAPLPRSTYLRPRRPRDAARPLGAQHRQLRLRHRAAPRLALVDLPAVLRRRRHLLGLRDGRSR